MMSCGVRARNWKETATHMHGHAGTARPPGRPDERPDERASYKLKVHSPAPAGSLAEPPPAASPQLGRWICRQGLRSARMRCLLLVLAAARLLLLLLLLLLAAAAASTTAALLAFLRLVTFRTGVIFLELATICTTTTAVSIFYLCSLQPRQAA